jgi:hypothetical protein
MRATIFTLALAAATATGIGAASAQRMQHDMSGHSMGGSTTMQRDMSGSRMGTMERSTGSRMGTMERSTETRSMTREPRTTGSTTRSNSRPGASEYAPGQMKRMGSQPSQSARDFAPGRSSREAPGQMMNDQRRR